MKLATLNLKLASLRIQTIGQRRRNLEENRVGKKTTLRILFAIKQGENRKVECI